MLDVSILEPPIVQEPPEAIPRPKPPATQRKRQAASNGEVQEQPSKKRGKFVTADPEAHLRIEREKISGTSKSFMRNGLGMNPISVNGNPIKFQFTCPFDSLSELLRNGYVLSETFREYVDQNSTDEHENFFKFLSIYARQGPNATVYSRRAHILHQIFHNDPSANRNLGMLDCSGPPGDVLRKIVHEDCQALLEQTCTNCFEQFWEPCTTISLSGLNVCQDGFTQLNQALERCQVFKENLQCFQCNSYEIAVESMTVQPYLHIVVEDQFHKYQCGLDGIPTSLKLAQSEYVLVGAIEFKMNIKHFVPFCHFGSGQWDERDDISSKPQRRTLTPSEIKKKEHSIVLCMYNLT